VSVVLYYILPVISVAEILNGDILSEEVFLQDSVRAILCDEVVLQFLAYWAVEMISQGTVDLKYASWGMEAPWTVVLILVQLPFLEVKEVEMSLSLSIPW
jgi:hypothetical protein